MAIKKIKILDDLKGEDKMMKSPKIGITPHSKRIQRKKG